MSRPILVHNVPELEPNLVPGFRIALRTRTAQELLAAVTSGNVAAVVVNLDEPQALTLVTQVAEAQPGVGLVGVMARTDGTAVIAALRAGCTEVTLRPLSGTDLCTALERASASAATARNGRTVAMFGTTGGAGSTTLACHLAVECATVTQQPVALVDLDLEFGGVASAFDAQPSFTLADVSRAGVIDSALIERAALNLSCGVRVLARPPEIDEAHAIDETLVRQMMHAVRGLYPVVVVDLPRQLTPVVGAVLEQVDKLVLVTQLTVPSLRNARRLLESLQGEGVPSDRLEFVINRYRRGVHTLTIENAEEELRRPAFGVVPSDFRAVHQALDSGRPLSDRNPVRAAIQQMAAKIASPPAEAPARGRWLAKLGLGR